MNAKFYVPFGTAKLLKEIGYPQRNSDMYYNFNGKLMTRAELEAGYKEEFPILITDCFAAPAYCEVIDWLAASKEIYIDIRNTFNEEWYCYIRKRSFRSITDSYSQLEQAINEAIINILEDVL